MCEDSQSNPCIRSSEATKKLWLSGEEAEGLNFLTRVEGLGFKKQEKIVLPTLLNKESEAYQT